jgi:hypothetical protein
MNLFERSLQLRPERVLVDAVPDDVILDHVPRPGWIQSAGEAILQRDQAAQAVSATEAPGQIRSAIEPVCKRRHGVVAQRILDGDEPAPGPDVLVDDLLDER